MSADPQAWKSEIAAGARGDWVDDARRELYATDASLYRQLPSAVLRPLDRADAARAVAICARHGVPVIARGGGTSLTGQSVGAGLILDFSTHLNRVLEINAAERWVRVEPGATRDELNAALRPHGLLFAPDPASGYAATVGGMIATNAAGMRSIRYGMTVDHVRELTVIDGSGEVRRYGPDNPDDTPGVATLRRLVRDHAAEIRARTPAVLRRSGGYRLDALLGGEFNPARIFCSAEGTLGVVVEARLNVEPLPGPATLVLAAYPDVWAALRATPGRGGEGHRRAGTAGRPLPAPGPHPSTRLPSAGRVAGGDRRGVAGGNRGGGPRRAGAGAGRELARGDPRPGPPGVGVGHALGRAGIDQSRRGRGAAPTLYRGRGGAAGPAGGLHPRGA
jgi:FAD/FMN-containing dehydrogenase